MTKKLQLLNLFAEDNSLGVASKNKELKKAIINKLDETGNLTIADMARDLNISIPKITSLIAELKDDGLVVDEGKIDSTGGRRASIYGLVSDACYFIGVDVKKYYINIGLLNFKKRLVNFKEKIPFQLQNTQESLKNLISCIQTFIQEQNVKKEKILSIGINLSGRINNTTGYSFSYFHFYEQPLSEIIQKEVGIRTFLENDSRSMAYGEFCDGVVTHEKNVIFLNLDYGIGTGILIDGQVYYGKSGFSGEFGHIPIYENEIICQCGKRGCLETEVSGWALIQKFKEKIKHGSTSILTKHIKNMEELQLEDLVKAVKNDDTLSIELFTEFSEKLGKAVAVLINLFNPELVVLGGILAETGDFIRLPVRVAVNKYSLSLVSTDTQFKLSKLAEKAGVIGGSLIARKKILS